MNYPRFVSQHALGRGVCIPACTGKEGVCPGGVCLREGRGCLPRGVFPGGVYLGGVCTGGGLGVSVQGLPIQDTQNFLNKRIYEICQICQIKILIFSIYLSRQKSDVFRYVYSDKSVTWIGHYRLSVPNVQDLLSVRSARPGKIAYHVNLHHLAL